MSWLPGSEVQFAGVVTETNEAETLFNYHTDAS